MQAALTWLTTPIIQRYLFTTPRFRFIYICTYVNMFAGLYVCKVSTFLVTLLFGSLLRVARVFSGFHHYSPYVLCFPLLHWIFVKFFCWFCKIHTNKIYVWHSINGQKQLLKWWKIFVRIKTHTHTLSTTSTESQNQLFCHLSHNTTTNSWWSLMKIRHKSFTTILMIVVTTTTACSTNITKTTTTYNATTVIHQPTCAATVLCAIETVAQNIDSVGCPTASLEQNKIKQSSESSTTKQLHE